MPAEPGAGCRCGPKQAGRFERRRGGGRRRSRRTTTATTLAAPAASCRRRRLRALLLLPAPSRRRSPSIVFLGDGGRCAGRMRGQNRPSLRRARARRRVWGKLRGESSCARANDAAAGWRRGPEAVRGSFSRRPAAPPESRRLLLVSVALGLAPQTPCSGGWPRDWFRFSSRLPRALRRASPAALAACPRGERRAERRA
jgi:hypothetical protein